MSRQVTSQWVKLFIGPVSKHPKISVLQNTNTSHLQRASWKTLHKHIWWLLECLSACEYCVYICEYNAVSRANRTRFVLKIAFNHCYSCLSLLSPREAVHRSLLRYCSSKLPWRWILSNMPCLFKLCVNYYMCLCIRAIVCVNVCVRVLHGFVKYAHQRNWAWRTDHRKAFPSVSRAAVITLSMTVSQRWRK